MGLKGVRVDGVTYRFDHAFLENNPEEMPAYDEGDVGKALVVHDSSELCLLWAAINQLPPCYSSDDGKLLSVDDEGHPQWVELDLLPHVDAGGRGVVLGVTSTCEPEWTTLYGVVSDDYTANGDSLVVENGEIVARRLIPERSDGDGNVLGMTSSCELGWVTIDQLPDRDGNTGKLLGVDSYGELRWTDPLPDRDGNVGKLLVVSECGNELVWSSIEEVMTDPLPDRDKGDVNKLLVVANTGGDLMWSSIDGIMSQIPGGGSGESVLVYSCEGLRWEAR